MLPNQNELKLSNSHDAYAIEVRNPAGGDWRASGLGQYPAPVASDFVRNLNRLPGGLVVFRCVLIEGEGA